MLKRLSPSRKGYQTYFNIFLLSIIKSCEHKVEKLNDDTVLNVFGPDFGSYFEVKHCCMRYGVGMDRPTKIFDAILGDNNA